MEMHLRWLIGSLMFGANGLVVLFAGRALRDQTMTDFWTRYFQNLIHCAVVLLGLYALAFAYAGLTGPEPAWLPWLLNRRSPLLTVGAASVVAWLITYGQQKRRGRQGPSHFAV